MKIELPVSEYIFEDIEVGQEVSIDYQVLEADVVAFANLSGDYSPLHLDEQFARRTQYRGCIAHGMLVSLPVSTLVGMCLPGKYATLLDLGIHYKQAVKVGDKLTLIGTVTAKSPSIRVVALEFVIKKGKEIMVTGGARMMVGEKPKDTPTMAELSDTIASLNLDFGGAVALVTGASRGIGAITAKLLAGCGARVAVNYHKGKADAETIGRDISAHHGPAIAVKADVSDRVAVHCMFDEIKGTLGHVDILVNNAVSSATPKRFLNLTHEAAQSAMNVTFWGAFYCCQSALPAMLEKKKGVIVNVTTGALYNPEKGSVAYVSAKGALHGFNIALSTEVEPQGICVRTFVPPVTDTDLLNYVPAYHKFRMELGHPIDVACDIVARIGELWNSTT